METMGRQQRRRRSFTKEFKAEVVDLVRQPGNSVPSGATSTTFGVIRSAGAMRRLQLGVRLTF